MKDLILKYKNAAMFMKLIYINVAVFLILFPLTLFWSESSLFLVDGLYTAVPANLNVLLLRPWTLLTHMFTHFGVMHILMNMFMLYILGRIFEQQFGRKKMLSTYLLGGFAGAGLFILIINMIPAWGINNIAVGASAAVMAIFVAYATYNPDQKFRLILFGEVAVKYLAIGYVLIDYLSLGGANTGGHVGHLGGALYGFLMASQLKKGKDINAWFERILDRITNVFTRSKGTKGAKTNNSRGKSDEQYNYEKAQRSKRMDQILDKIGRGGYDSLNKDEKDFLFRNSKDL
ncbi:MAG: rhomboid family intramembrane serine protease [Flavobacteriales bacterium]